MTFLLVMLLEPMVVGPTIYRLNSGTRNKDTNCQQVSHIETSPIGSIINYFAFHTIF